jgi:hypothetical protein
MRLTFELQILSHRSYLRENTEYTTDYYTTLHHCRLRRASDVDLRLLLLGAFSRTLALAVWCPFYELLVHVHAGRFGAREDLQRTGFVPDTAALTAIEEVLLDVLPAKVGLIHAVWALIDRDRS